MIHRVARLVLPALVALLAGCSAVTPEPPTPPTPDTNGPEVAPPPRELIYLEVTPAAARAIRSHVADLKLERWWLRYRLEPGGCSGFQNKLDLETATPTDGDYEYVADGIPCLVFANQRHLVQGVRIDFGAENGRTGFIVTAPHATEQTKEAVSKWIMDEFRKRNPDVVPDPESK